MSSFSQEKIASVSLIRCPQNIDKEAAEEFQRLMKDWAREDVILQVMDFATTQSISSLFYRPLAQFHKELKGRGLTVISIHLAQRLKDQINHDGMDPVFAPFQTLKDALHHAGLSREKKASGPPQLNDAFVHPVAEGLIKAIESLGGIKLQSESTIPEFTMKNPEDLEIHAGAGIDLFGTGVQGRVALYFSTSALEKFFHSATQKQLLDGDLSRAQDLVREALNMAMGNARGKWQADHGHQFDRSLPKTLHGEKLKEHIHEFLPNARILKFSGGSGGVYLGISLSPAK